MVASEASFTHIVHSVEMSRDGLLTVKGIIKSDDSLGDTIHLMVKKRKSKTFFIVPLKWPKINCWETTVDFNKMDVSKGTWDYYLLYSNEQKYRLKIEDERIFDWDRTAVFNREDVTYGLTCYITEKDSLSSIVYTPTIHFDIQQCGVRNDYSIQMIGKITGNEFTDSVSGIQFLIKQRDGDKQHALPLEVIPEKNHISVDLKINYNDILPENLTNMTWDLYMKFWVNGIYYLFRVHLANKASLEKETCVELHGDEVYQAYLYPTINWNISINLRKLQMKRNIISYGIEDHHIILKGYAYFELMPFDSLDKMQRYIKIRKRHSDKELFFPIDNEELDESGVQDVYRFSGFNTTIPLKKIFSLQESEMDIFDFSICLVYDNQEKERTLGCEEYDYFVDYPLASDSLQHRLKGIRTFLLFTPGGHLKLETYAYALRKMMYMKYQQARTVDSRKNVWLIGERPDTAQDTGYHFFKFCRENYPEKNIYYVITADSPDRKNLQGLDNIITFGSMKHFKLAATADTFIGSHDVEYLLPTKAVDWPNYQESKRVFLQHGVLGRKKVDYDKQYYKYPFTMVCVSSRPEYNLVTKRMGYDSNEVKITGLSRFDRLMENHEAERSILLIPTWRDWIREHEFTDSEYFSKYKELLSDDRLNELLEKYNIKLDFYVHYRMQSFVHQFYGLASDHINIIEFGQADVQELLIRNELLITDYSSVSFDFNYMRKPVLFYHFDFERFFKNGLLRPAGQTFLGDICKDKESLIDTIEKYIENGFKEKSAVRKKKGTIFTHIDDENNERIYDAIIRADRP